MEKYNKMSAWAIYLMASAAPYLSVTCPKLGEFSLVLYSPSSEL